MRKPEPAHRLGGIRERMTPFIGIKRCIGKLSDANAVENYEDDLCRSECVIASCTKEEPFFRKIPLHAKMKFVKSFRAIPIFVRWNARKV
jgi:hypothetical protein